MAIDTAASTPSAPAVPPSDGWLRRDRVGAWILLAAWLALVVAALVTGQRPSTYAQLEAGVAVGDVRQVELVGEPLADGATGWSATEVHWQAGWVSRTARVVQASSERQAARAARQSGDDTTAIVGSVEDRLRELDPDVTFTRGEHRSASFTMAGLETPGWIGLGYLVVLLATLTVTTGPQPWRATRWAWFWLVLLVPPYGIAAYLLLGGPTGLLPPRDRRRVWLTGGWAFLLALLLGGGAAAS